MYIEYLPELVIIEIDPSDEPQANIKPQSGDAQDTAFTKKCQIQKIQSVTYNLMNQKNILY